MCHAELVAAGGNGEAVSASKHPWKILHVVIDNLAIT
jgi:hypothetical protein